MKNPNKKQADMLLPVSPKVGLGNNCSVFNDYDFPDREFFAFVFF